MKKKHCSLSTDNYCHTLLSSGPFRRIRKCLPLALLPLFLSSKSFILWFNTYVVSDWKFRSYIPYPQAPYEGFFGFNANYPSRNSSLQRYTFLKHFQLGNFLWPFMGMEICRFRKYCLPSSLTGFPYTSTRMHLFPCVPLRSKVTVEAFWGTIKVCVITWSTWFPWKRYKTKLEETVSVYYTTFSKP